MLPKDETSRGDGQHIRGIHSREQGARIINTNPLIPDRIQNDLGYPYVEDLQPTMAEPAAVSAVPEKIARHYKILPLQLKSGKLIVAAADPNDLRIVDDLSKLSGVTEVVVWSAGEKDVSTCQDHVYGTAKREAEVIKGHDDNPPLKTSARRLIDLTGSDDEAEEVAQVLHVLLRRAFKQGASDISFEPAQDELVVMFKIGGRWYPIEPPCNLRWHKGIVSIIKLHAGMDITEDRRPLDGGLVIRYGDVAYNVRVATAPTIHGEGMTLRVLDPRNAERTFVEIGFSSEDADIIRREINKPYGIILVTGPTGSGKTTTLYACLASRNDGSTKIVTIEDPVEYVVRGLNQISINERIGLTFPTVLKSVLRQAPDVILVGEIRDLETANVAAKAAQTGHLVFSTLHTNGAIASISRLIDLGVPAFVVAETVRAVISQRLVRRLCPRCSVLKPLNPETVARLNLGAHDLGGRSVLMGPVGCSHCYDGYSGRVAIYETLLVNDSVRGAIRTGITGDDLEKVIFTTTPMATMEKSGIRKALEGVTTLEEVVRATVV